MWPRSRVALALAAVALLRPLGPLADPDPGAADPRVADAAASPHEIQFRLITEADFLAKHPPPDLVQHPAGLNAVSCLRIGWPAGFHIDFRSTGFSESTTSASASPRFVALFDRSCSWWSSKPEDAGYALLHEQVHFAITEYAARALTEELRTAGRVLRGYGPTRSDALANLEQSMRTTAFRARMAARREHDAFDAETSRDRSEAVQQKWVDRYEKRLGVRLSR
jgi:hypothetical protein